MVERPILMKGPLVVRTLEGAKTETRRPIKRTWVERTCRKWEVFPGPSMDEPEFRKLILPHCPYGVVGDRLWVRETVQYPKSYDDESPSAIAKRCLDAGYHEPWAPIRYCADGGTVNGDVLDPDIGWGKGRPSIHMPRWACRLVLEVKAVGIARVQDITEEEAVAEGVVPLHHRVPHRAKFRQLWDDIYGKQEGIYSWDVNPWVWAVKFKRVTS